MIVRRYTGSSLEKLRATITKELGKEAVIISTEKKRKKGLLPNMGKMVYEVTAVLEDALDADNRPEAEDYSNNLKPLLENQHQQYRGLRQSMRMMDEKLADVDQWMETITSRLLSNGKPTQLANVHDEWIPMLAAKAATYSKNGEVNTEHYFNALKAIIPAQPGLNFKSKTGSGPAVYAVTGPTGVGKTTTLAKLTAKAVLNMKMNAAMVTIDTYRLAGVEQLREYASLLGVELAVAFSPQEFMKHLSRFQNKDIIFIDTPGRGQFDSVGINDIRTKLKATENVSTILAVPASVRKRDAETVFESYKIVSPQALVLTKTDEATCCDGLTRLFDITKLPVVYMTDGQRVPEDIVEADQQLIASLIMPEGLPIEDTETDLEKTNEQQ